MPSLPSLLPSVITGFISAALSSIVTYFGTRSKIRLDLTVEYDKQLREKRLKLYSQLWPMTEPLGKFAISTSFTHSRIFKVSKEMHDWYFGEAGLYLSKRCRKPYFDLKESLQRVIEDEELAAKPDTPISDEARHMILDAASTFRTRLSDDIRTRKGPWL